MSDLGQKTGGKPLSATQQREDIWITMFSRVICTRHTSFCFVSRKYEAVKGNLTMRQVPFFNSGCAGNAVVADIPVKKNLCLRRFSVTCDD